MTKEPPPVVLGWGCKHQYYKVKINSCPTGYTGRSDVEVIGTIFDEVN